MSQGMGLFGMKIEPGQVVPLDIFSDVRITNIAFGEKITGYARSVVKVHRARFADPLDDFSSDEDDDDEDGEDESDESEEAVEGEISAQVNGKKKKAAKEDEDEDEESDSEQGEYDEEGEGEEDDEDDDEEDDSEIVEEDFVICSLYPEKTEQATVDLEFSVEEEIAFSVTGQNAVELTGYYLPSDPYDEDPDSDELYSDDEYDSDELAMYDELEGEEDSEDDEMEEDQPRIEEILEQAAAKASSDARSSKKRSKGEESDEEVEATKDSIEHLSKNQRKKLNKKLKTEVEHEKAEVKEKEKSNEAAKADVPKKVSKEAPKETKEASKKIKTASGLVIEDKEIGKGPQAKSGQRIGMRYVGRLTNGKQFDANTKGKPFVFKLGKGEVIAGWDEGIKGMQVGGTRRLTIPPQLAYGKRGSPPEIPANSTLVFDVKLVEIK